MLSGRSLVILTLPRDSFFRLFSFEVSVQTEHDEGRFSKSVDSKEADVSSSTVIILYGRTHIAWIKALLTNRKILHSHRFLTCIPD